MDEKDHERKIIQNYVFKNAFKRKTTVDDEKENKKGKGNGIVKMVEESRRKR